MCAVDEKTSSNEAITYTPMVLDVWTIASEIPMIVGTGSMPILATIYDEDAPSKGLS